MLSFIIDLANLRLIGSDQRQTGGLSTRERVLHAPQDPVERRVGIWLYQCSPATAAPGLAPRAFVHRNRLCRHRLSYPSIVVVACPSGAAVVNRVYVSALRASILTPARSACAVI